jgi:hypothetical protein
MTTQTIRFLFLGFCIFAIQPVFSQLYINEVCPGNADLVFDEFGADPDWIEIYNASPVDVDLTGYFLTDDPLDLFKWEFPGGTISANGFLKVFASGNDLISTFLHTNFTLAKSGETVILTTPGGSVVDFAQYPEMQVNHSYGRSPDGTGSLFIFSQITPGTSNTATPWPGYSAAPSFSLPAGFYSGLVSVAISTDSISEIRYTLDGSIPTVASPVYITPIFVGVTTPLRARAFHPNLLPSLPATNTYFINDTSHLPVISISTDPENLWGDSGIYVAGTDTTTPPNYFQDWRIEVYLEYFAANQQQGFEQTFGCEIYGGGSRHEPLKSLKIMAGEIYGSSVLNYQLFEDKPLTEFKRFGLRNGGDDFQKAHMRDALVNKLMLNDPTSDIDVTAYQPTVVFLNGAYWGIHNMREKVDRYYLQYNHGISPDSVDLLQHRTAIPVDGDNLAFFATKDFIVGNDMAIQANFDQAAEMVDMNSYVDWIAVNAYFNNNGWPQEDLKYWIGQPNGYKLRYVMVDIDQILMLNNSSPVERDLLGEEYVTTNTNPHAKMTMKLWENPGFKTYFINRYADLINTTFDTTSFLSYVDEVRDNLLPEMGRHVSRWASTLNQWNSQIDNRIKVYIKNRPFYQRNYIEQYFALAGQVDVTLDAVPAAGGKIQISTVTPDNYPWSGVYFNGNPVTITATPNPGYYFDHWETNNFIAVPDSNESMTLNISQADTFRAVFSGFGYALTISEINYNSGDSLDSGDWFELYNFDTAPIDLSGWTVTDKNPSNSFSFPNGTTIPGSSRLVVCRDLARFSSVYPAVSNFVGPFGFGLGNVTDEITVSNSDGIIISMVYMDSLDWPTGVGGLGRTLELTTIGVELSNAASWFSGCVGGSPGTYFSTCDPPLVFSEINYNSSGTTDAGDWVEILNNSQNAIDISDYLFRDGNDLHNYFIPAGTLLQPGEYWVIYEDLTLFEGQHQGVANKSGPFTFGLSSFGEPLRLYNNSGKLIHSVVYGGLSPWPMGANDGGYTLELANPSGNVNDPNNWYAGCPGGSPGTSFVPDCIPCELPMQIAVSAITDSTSQITWSAAAEADEYSLQIRELGDSIWSQFSTSNGVLQISDLATCTDYEFQIESVCPANSSGFSGLNTFTTTGCPIVCTQPTGVNAAALSPTSVFYGFNPDPIALAWQIQYRIPPGQGGGGAGTDIEPAGSIGKIIDGLLPGTQYQSRVRKKCSDTIFSPWKFKAFATDNPKLRGENDWKINIYPQPAGQYLFIEVLGQADGGGEIRIEFYNTIGQHIYSISEESATFLKKKIDVSTFPDGAYFVKMRMENFASYQKIIIIR